MKFPAAMVYRISFFVPTAYKNKKIQIQKLQQQLVYNFPLKGFFLFTNMHK